VRFLSFTRPRNTSRILLALTTAAKTVPADSVASASIRQTPATLSSGATASHPFVGRRLPHDRGAAVTVYGGGGLRLLEPSAMTTTMTKAVGVSAAVTPSSAGVGLPPPPFKLSYIDFPPRCAGAGNVICAPDYERF